MDNDTLLRQTLIYMQVGKSLFVKSTIRKMAGKLRALFLKEWINNLCEHA